MRKYQTLICFWVMMMGVAGPLTANTENTSRRLYIYLPHEPSLWEVRAADLLSEAWKRWAGAEVVREQGRSPRAAGRGPLLHGGQSVRGWEFSIGNTAFNQNWVPRIPSEDTDAYGYRAKGFLAGIRGNTPRATYLATSRFIQDELGMAWLYPGETGWAMDRPYRWQGLHVRKTGQPGYLSRHIFGMNQAGVEEWRNRNGLFSRFQFHHNLHRIFTEEVYDQHPEFFPLQNGMRIRPDRRLGGNNAQISFGLEAAARFAGEHAIRYFEQHPQQISFSLGMNDTHTFGESEEFLRGVQPLKTFRGIADYSNLIFRFMNQAAETLAEHYPDRYLGCLAYNVAENVPDFPVHPQVIPYLTADRTLYWDEAFRQEDEDLQRRWNMSGVRFWGTYDYFYGAPYDHVFSYRQLLKETAVAAYFRGARGAVAEVNPRWGLMMPLPWMLTQLWWNPQQDVDALYERFYRLAFGPAATEMADFYQYGDSVWLRQSGQVYWLRNYYHPIQWTWWQEQDFVIQRERLQRAKDLIGEDSIWYPRWLMVDREWRQLEAGWHYWNLLRTLTKEARMPDEQEMQQILEDLRWIRAEIREEIWQQHGIPAWNSLALTGAVMQRRPEYPLVAALMKTRPQLSVEQRTFFQEWNRLLPRSVWLPLLAIHGNESELPWQSIRHEGETDWQLWDRPGSKGKVLVRARHSDRESWEIREAGESRLYRNMTATGERNYRISSVFSGKVTEGSRVELQVYFCDADGQRLRGNDGRSWIYMVYPGRWQREPLEYWVQAPATAHSMILQMVVVEQAAEDWSLFTTPQVDEWRQP